MTVTSPKTSLLYKSAVILFVRRDRAAVFACTRILQSEFLLRLSSSLAENVGDNLFACDCNSHFLYP